MKIVLDGRVLSGGIGRHVRWLRRRLAERVDSDCLVIYGSEGRGVAGALPRRALPRAAAGALKRIVEDQWVLPQTVVKSGADVFHSPNYLVPRRLSIPAVVNCYDLTLIDHFDTKKSGAMKVYERKVMHDSLGRAAFIVTPSGAVREELLERFDLDPERVVTIHPEPPVLPELSIAEQETLLPTAARGQFFLTVGTVEPRKNLGRLLDAHARIWPETRIPLLLAGPYGWRQRDVLRRVRRSRGAVHWLGWVPDGLLGTLYSRATAVVQPSLAEGFDLPVLEAMQAGAPLVLSELAVHREVAGDLALYASAVDVESLAERMSEIVLWNDERRLGQSRRAAARVESLARNSGVDLYLDVYRQVIES